MKCSRFFIIYLLFLTHLLQANTFTVINPNDSGPGSFRQAIIDANGDPDPSTSIVFAIASGVQTINILPPDLPDLTKNNTTIDGTTQPGWSPDDPQIVIDFGTTFGLSIAANNCTIQGLVLFNGFINLLIFEGNANAVYGCFVGTNQTGTAAGSGGTFAGIYLFNTTNAIIGGVGAAEGNLVSGNTAGIFLDGSTAATIVHNRIGTNKAGTAAIPNSDGIALINGSTATIGGASSTMRNIISGNLLNGINIDSSSAATIQGNFIGTDITGTSAIGNDTGILISSSGNTVGGSSAGEGNIISGNLFGIFSSFNNNNIIQGNFIGTDVSGTNALGNTDIGISFFNSTDNSIIDNVISDNGRGIELSSNSNNTIIQGNFIGTDITGTIALGNGDMGILSITSLNNTIGGTAPGQRNIISANGEHGISLTNGSNDNIIQGNFIGTDSTGTLNLGNGLDGINLFGGSNNNSIGGLLGDAPINTIAYNGAFGVEVGFLSVLNPILKNSIFNNGGNGIELVAGGNNEQPSPVVLEAVDSVSSVNTITVTAQAPLLPAGDIFRLEFFINDINRNPITEGQTFLGAIDAVPSGAIVTATFTSPLPSAVGKYISATATNLNNVGDTPGDTSEFSDNVIITAAPITTPQSLIVRAILAKYPCVG